MLIKISRQIRKRLKVFSHFRNIDIENSKSFWSLVIAICQTVKDALALNF